MSRDEQESELEAIGKQMIADAEKKRSDLRWAILSRVLTDDEMAEVGRIGASLFVRNNTSYRQSEVDRQFSDALFQQFRFKLAEKIERERGA